MRPHSRTVELIDVLWLNGNAIVAAFEAESTTSIYSGLLRMADLLSMQPNEHSAVSCRPGRAQAEGIHRSQQADLLAFVAATCRRLPVRRLLNTARSTRTGEILHPVT
jgi:hypothetical protein